jgi:uncharacterized protein (TIGR02646 family)
MIRIVRSACPPCLENAPTTGTAYRKRQVVEALWRMQYKKCCYSEMPIPQEGHGKAVEHFQPQGTFSWRRNEWRNLLLVSPQCNGKKSNQFPVMLTDNEDEVKVLYLTTRSTDRPAIIDPSDPASDPEEHLTYVLDDGDPLYGQVIPRERSVLGHVTIGVTGIDDEFFLRVRKARVLEVLDVTYRNILIAENDENTASRDAQLATFGLFVEATAPFAGLARQYARRKKLDQRFGLVIPGPDVV